METEIEAKFLNIDPTEIRAKLKDVGAQLVYAERLMRRRVYEQLNNEASAWIRVRDEGDKITLSYKKTENWGLHGTKEFNIEVSDFEKTCSILTLFGLREKAFQETKRELWVYEGVEITIDTWPWLKPLVEIEGPNEASVKNTAQLLNLLWEKALFGPVSQAYQHYFKATEDKINNYPVMKFSDQAPWPTLHDNS